MTRSVQIKLALTLAGIVIWGYGARYDYSTVRLVGIALIGLAFVLRFVKRPTGE